MSAAVLQKVDSEIKKYKSDHHGESPLYILASPQEADQLFEELRQINNSGNDVVITSYKECKIVKNDSLKKGELRLTNELPEGGS